MAVIEVKTNSHKQRPVKPGRAKDRVLKTKAASTAPQIRLMVNERPPTHVYVDATLTKEEQAQVISRWQSTMARNRKIPSIKTYGKSLD